MTKLPPKSGLYDPAFEHDACGFGFVADVKGKASHKIVRQGVQILLNLVHRGACGCDPLTGDGAGLLLQIPHEFYLEECEKLGFDLPEPGTYGVGQVFLPNDKQERSRCEQIFEDKILSAGQKLLGWRDVPVNVHAAGPLARKSVPTMRQVFIGSACEDELEFERKLYIIRKLISNAVADSTLSQKNHYYTCSMSARTIVYKGLLLAEQLSEFYPDLNDSRVKSALAMVHQRFSTNTFPAWSLAQPFRTLCHNGEINTMRGNRAWMTAREKLFGTELFGEPILNILPIITPDASDSASLDNAAEMLMHAGRDLTHVMMMLVPEAWQNDLHMSPEKKAFYEYHSCLMEPWDGPAALAFTNGRQIGAILDRNGLRPARWTLTKDGTVVVGSETGVLEFPPEQLEKKGRLDPGRMFLIDLERGRIVEDEEIKEQLANAKPYGKWLADNLIAIEDLEEVPNAPAVEQLPLLSLQKLFGYTLEDVRVLIAPMAEQGAEAIGSMGTDTPLAVLSDEPQILFNYFKQHFAQVTNPAIDPIREELVMSLRTHLGSEGNLLEELPDQAQMLCLQQPILTNQEVAKLRYSNIPHQRKPATIPMLFEVAEGGAGLKAAIAEICRLASVAASQDRSFIILSDRGATPELAPVPALLATAAVHHHLVRSGARMKLGIVVETGEAREVHHFCLLTGYGASAINPYVAMDTVDDMVRSGALGKVTDVEVARHKFIKAVDKGMLKVMSKMGISTLQSYRGAQIFEAIGLSQDVIDRYFTGTTSRIQGIDLEVIAKEAALRHENAFVPAPAGTNNFLTIGGNYHYRAQGERHLWNPRAIGALQRAARQNDPVSYEEYSKNINDQTRGLITIRGMWDLVPRRAPVPIEEVESAKDIVRRFATGAMSFGSISSEAHENLAIAMNRIGGKSNTGEGGEKMERLTDERRSAIKQVASGRFGVTPYYLVNSDEIQIKISQGAKPGEGGQLPGHKVNEEIGKTRNSVPGVTLISPPPHHDIYSIEDLAQLIFDLKMTNPKARINVKLVAEAGVGTVAAGVAKAHADVILVSGHDGGTGASPQTSIKHAGIPWELGLAETHHVLVKNDLRSRVTLQTDGQMRTGRDVVIATLLGAEEFGFATGPLVASGCIMMRKCHLNTCPVGVATQDPELRKKFTGQPEHVINFMFFVAEETRKIMAELGFRTIKEMVGHSECLKVREGLNHWKASRLDFSELLKPADAEPGVGVHKQHPQDHGVDRTLDVELISRCRHTLEEREQTAFETPIRNTDRTVGAQLAGALSRLHGPGYLPEGTIRIRFRGTAGQSFGAFMVPGMDFHLYGDANDFTGKGMAGGVISVCPTEGVTYRASENILIGNVALYGATGGKAFFNGVAGERFCVRNSGAITVVEGVGDHACEYMTGGCAVIIGTTGRNFGAGMSGGLAFVLDTDGRFRERCNHGMIELEPLNSQDADTVRALLKEHFARTKSEQANALLKDWERSVTQFVKVIPVEYRRVLEERAQRQTQADQSNHPHTHPAE